jgi:hypothetical protein
MTKSDSTKNPWPRLYEHLPEPKAALGSSEHQAAPDPNRHPEHALDAACFSGVPESAQGGTAYVRF